MCSILQNAFPESTVLRLSLSCSFSLYSIDTLYYIIDFHMLNQPCISEMNLSCGISFFLNAARFSLLVFCRGHLHLFIRDLLLSHSVLSDSLWPHRLWPSRLLRPWGFPCKNTGGVAISSSRESSPPGDRTCVSYIAGGFFTAELPGNQLVLS